MMKIMIYLQNVIQTKVIGASTGFIAKVILFQTSSESVGLPHVSLGTERRALGSFCPTSCSISMLSPLYPKILLSPHQGPDFGIGNLLTLQIQFLCSSATVKSYP